MKLSIFRSQQIREGFVKYVTRQGGDSYRFQLIAQLHNVRIFCTFDLTRIVLRYGILRSIISSDVLCMGFAFGDQIFSSAIMQKLPNFRIIHVPFLGAIATLAPSKLQNLRITESFENVNYAPMLGYFHFSTFFKIKSDASQTFTRNERPLFETQKYY